ncbi:hypothetical protein ES703_48016 [subsurface metagenome]
MRDIKEQEKRNIIKDELKKHIPEIARMVIQILGKEYRERINQEN